jgi:hypothetical protein
MVNVGSEGAAAGLGGSFFFESFFRLGNDGAECGGIGDGEIREDLAVGFDASGFQAFHEARVGETLVADGGADTRDPQTAELTFALLTVAIFVGLRLTNSVFCVAEKLRAETAETFGAEQRTLAAFAAGR